MMGPLLIYDTETTAFPLWKEPSSDPGQPHICQLAAVLVDSGGSIMSSMNTIIKPDGWEITDEGAIKTHGITTEKALAWGIDIDVAMAQFFAMWRLSVKRIGFNEPFDARMVRIEILRRQAQSLAEEWKAGDSYCAMRSSRSLCNVPNAKGTGTKNPTLAEAYHHFTGFEHIDAHDAMGDVMATKDVYFGIVGEDYVEDDLPPATVSTVAPATQEDDQDDAIPDFL